MFKRFEDMRFVVFGAVLALHAGAGLTAARAQCELAKLLADDGAPVDYFGRRVAISGDTGVIGAPYDDDNGEDSGAAYVFRGSGGMIWLFEQKLLPEGGWSHDEFGTSVAISGDTAMVGAWKDWSFGFDQGAVYVFERYGSLWFERATLRVSDAYDQALFGNSVAISGDIAVIGAYHDQPHGFWSGSAYVFRFEGSSWVQEAKLVPADGAGHSEFGYSVAVSGDIAVIGARLDDEGCTNCGAAYVFRFDGLEWLEEQKLFAPGWSDNFGSSVAISGYKVLIGAGENAAHVFRFDGSSWVYEARLRPSDGWLGRQVALSGDTAVIGAPGDDDGKGSAYLFRFDGSGWVEEGKLLASDGQAADVFGCAVALSGATTVIGARGDDDNGSQSGSAYVFDLAGPDCNGNGICDIRDLLDCDGSAWCDDCNANSILDWCDIDSGASEDANGNGIPDECECVGDIDGDGDTDHADLGALLSAWGSQPGDPNWNPNADLDCDGQVGHSDLGILFGDWGCVP